MPPGPDPDRIGLEQVFDLEADPYETQNLAREPEHRERVHGFRQALFAFERTQQRRRIVVDGPVRRIQEMLIIVIARLTKLP